MYKDAHRSVRLASAGLCIIAKSESKYNVQQEGLIKSAVPNLFGTRDRFLGRQFFHARGRGWSWGGAVQAAMRAMGNGR